MKKIVITDGEGYMRRVIAKDTDSDAQAAKFGISDGPPDLRQLDWDAIVKEINNTLVKDGIFTWHDVQSSPNGLRGAFAVIKRHIIALYREEDRLRSKG